MAGGLFGQPFVLNVKCIIFSLIIIAIFLVNPSSVVKNRLIAVPVLFGIFVAAYVSMAWYDYYYNCTILPLRKGKYGITGLMKPEAHEPEKQYKGKMNHVEMHRHHITLYILHLLVIVPLISYIAFYHKRASPMSFILLGALAVYTVAYHGSEFVAAVSK